MSEAGESDGIDGPDDGAQSPRRAIMSVAEAATHLKITPDAIRGRMRRGTLEGFKRDGVWHVVMDANDRDGAPDGPVGDVPSEPVDTPSLAAVVDRLTRRNEELAASVGFFQARNQTLEERAKHLEEQVLALQSGSIAAPGPTHVAVGSPVPNATASDGSVYGGDDHDGSGTLWQRWGRWFRGE